MSEPARELPQASRPNPPASLPIGIAQSPAKLVAVLVADTESRVRKVRARTDGCATDWTAELRTATQVAGLAHEPMPTRADQLQLLIVKRRQILILQRGAWADEPWRESKSWVESLSSLPRRHRSQMSHAC